MEIRVTVEGKRRVNYTIPPLGSETWQLTKTLLSKVQMFVNKRLRQILGIFWPNVITNKDLWVRTGQEDEAITIKQRKWKWIGHTLRKEKENRIAMKWNPQGKRKQGSSADGEQ